MNNNNNKMAYTSPEITKVEIDNEISVVLMSPGPTYLTTPVGLGEGGNDDNNGNINGTF